MVKLNFGNGTFTGEIVAKDTHMAYVLIRQDTFFEWYPEWEHIAKLAQYQDAPEIPMEAFVYHRRTGETLSMAKFLLLKTFSNL